MRILLLLAVWLCLCAIPAFADKGDNRGLHLGEGHHHGAPAPLIGGLPAALVVGGVWIGRKLLKRKRRPNP